MIEAELAFTHSLDDITQVDHYRVILVWILLLLSCGR